MLQTRTILIAISLLIGANIFACINEHRTLLTGEVVLTDPSSGKIWNRDIDTLELRKKANLLIKSCDSELQNVESWSDYGAALIYLGELKKAKRIYEDIENKHPDLYSTASNLGTIYELINKPDSALLWIKKSIEINPNSHMGSEWIHVKILEFKISKSSDYKTSILNLKFGKGTIPSNPEKYDLEKMRRDIWHQLRERSNFIKPKNKIVGNIYFDLGNIIAQTRNVQAALESYNAAREYGFESELMNQRTLALEKLADKAKPSQFLLATKKFISSNAELFLVTVIIGFGLIIILIIRVFRKKHRSNKATN